MDDETITGVVVGLAIVFVALFLITMFNSPPTPQGYTRIDEHISYKCDGSIILWYDNSNHRPLPPTLNDGRCHAKI